MFGKKWIYSYANICLLLHVELVNDGIIDGLIPDPHIVPVGTMGNSLCSNGLLTSNLEDPTRIWMDEYVKW